LRASYLRITNRTNMNTHTDTRSEYEKEQYKKYIAAWLRSFGQIQIGEECIEPLCKVIDNTHKNMKRKNRLPDRC
jgi:hypothetical protein